jgi:hypothetical protein
MSEINFEHNQTFHGQYRRITNEYQFKDAIKQLQEQWDKNGWLEVQVRTPQSRTLKQNNSMHLYYEMVASQLNDNGLDMRKFLKESFDIHWTGQNVKEYIWKPVQTVLFGSKSTTKIKKAEVSQVYDVINRKLAEHGIHVPFPENQDDNEG